MLDEKIFNDFIHEINKAWEQFCIWVNTNNQFAKHQEEWNKIVSPNFFKTEEFSKDKGCKYKNFWDIIIASVQYNWILSIARLLDPPYFSRDTKKEKPRLSLDYIIELIENDNLKQSIEEKINKHKETIKTIKEQRDNVLAHNDVKFKNTVIKGGIEDFFKTLDNIITEIKNNEIHLKYCNNIDIKYLEKLSKCGVDEIFENL